jgi:hypothetical protein
VEVESVDHACVTRLLDLETASYVGSGKIVKLPVRLTSSDGLLDWSGLATYELGDAAANLPHRLWFEQQLTPVSMRWQEASRRSSSLRKRTDFSCASQPGTRGRRRNRARKRSRERGIRDLRANGLPRQ